MFERIKNAITTQREEPFEENRIYFNEDAGQHIYIDSISRTTLHVRYEWDPENTHMANRSLYQDKYEAGVIVPSHDPVFQAKLMQLGFEVVEHPGRGPNMRETYSI